MPKTKDSIAPNLYHLEKSAIAVKEINKGLTKSNNQNNSFVTKCCLNFMGDCCWWIYVRAIVHVLKVNFGNLKRAQMWSDNRQHNWTCSVSKMALGTTKWNPAFDSQRPQTQHSAAGLDMINCCNSLEWVGGWLPCGAIAAALRLGKSLKSHCCFNHNYPEQADSTPDLYSSQIAFAR